MLQDLLALTETRHVQWATTKLGAQDWLKFLKSDLVVLCRKSEIEQDESNRNVPKRSEVKCYVET